MVRKSYYGASAILGLILGYFLLCSILPNPASTDGAAHSLAACLAAPGQSIEIWGLSGLDAAKQKVIAYDVTGPQQHTHCMLHC